MFEKKIFAELAVEEQPTYVASLEAEVDRLTEEVAANQKAMLEAAEEIKKVSKQKAGKKEAGVIVKVDGEKYKFTVKKFTFDFIKYTAEEAATDAELCATLVKIGFGGLEKI